MTDLVLITRPKEQGFDYAKELEAQGFSCFVEPMLSIMSQDFSAPDLYHYDGLLFTSAQAVQFFAGSCNRFDIPVYCVGKHSQDTAQSLGFSCVYSAEGTGKDLVDFVASVSDAQNMKFIHIHGRHLAYPVADKLMEQGIMVDEVIVYHTVPSASLSEEFKELLLSGKIGVVTFFSRRTATAFMDLVKREGLESYLSSIKVLSISDTVLECVRASAWEGLYVSRTPDRAGMLDMLRDITC